MKVLLNTPYGQTTAKELGADLVIECLGQRYKSDFLHDNFRECISKNGQIFVNDLFQISKVDPRIDSLA